MAARKRKPAPVVRAEAVVRMSVFLPEATVRRIKAAAAARGMSMSQLMGRLVDESPLTAEHRMLREDR
ncbi:MAG: hypothetical protein HY615_15410 [Candidatus Rokubacteria bacterium]|nr:hypothetical protein [Candidatus Rokubacteria bacterium]